MSPFYNILSRVHLNLGAPYKEEVQIIYLYRLLTTHLSYVVVSAYVITYFICP